MTCIKRESVISIPYLAEICTTEKQAIKSFSNEDKGGVATGVYQSDA